MKKNYFIMLSDPPWGGPTPIRASQWSKMLNFGRLISEDPGLFRFILKVEDDVKDPKNCPPLDWHDPDKGHTLFSARMRNALDRAGVGNIQYFPAEVVYEPTGKVCDYQVANVLGLVSLLDRQRSDYDADEDGFIEELRTMVFNESKAKGLIFFRLYEYGNLIIVHKTVRQVIEESALTGMKFIEDVEWEQGMI